MGVNLQDENKLEEMSKITEHYMTYVPTVEAKGHLVLPNEDSLIQHSFPFFFGGDQLTVVRIHGTQPLRDSHDKLTDRLEGLLPVVEDWHTRMVLMKVSWFIHSELLIYFHFCVS